jgi:hypothetical protein
MSRDFDDCLDVNGHLRGPELSCDDESTVANTTDDSLHSQEGEKQLMLFGKFIPIAPTFQPANLENPRKFVEETLVVEISEDMLVYPPKHFAIANFGPPSKKHAFYETLVVEVFDTQQINETWRTDNKNKERKKPCKTLSRTAPCRVGRPVRNRRQPGEWWKASSHVNKSLRQLARQA